MRILFPGLALPPDDYAGLVAVLDGETRVLNTLADPVTSPFETLRTALDAGQGPHELIGHSIGALSAIEWALGAPYEVSRTILLDPSDPWGRPVPPLLGGPAGAGLRWAVSGMSRSPALARSLGRRGRAAMLGIYGVAEDPLTAERVAALFGNRDALGAVARQLTDVPHQLARVRALLARSSELPTATVIASTGGNGRPDPSVLRLAERIGARTEFVPAGHLFPMTNPVETAALIAQSS